MVFFCLICNTFKKIGARERNFVYINVFLNLGNILISGFCKDKHCSSWMLSKSEKDIVCIFTFFYFYNKKNILDIP